MKMHVTAFVLCHKLEQYVDRAIASIVTQKRLPDQIVLLGTDCRKETYESFRRWESHPIKNKIVMTTEKMTCAQSKAFAGQYVLNKNATGGNTEAFFVLDADDWILPRFVDRCTNYLENSNAGAVGCDYQILLQDGTLNNASANLARTYDLGKSNPLPACSIVRASAYRDAGGYRQGLMFEDWALWVAMTANGHQIFRFPQTLFVHTRHETNITNGVDHELGREQIKCLMSSFTEVPSAPGSSSRKTGSMP